MKSIKTNLIKCFIFRMILIFGIILFARFNSIGQCICKKDPYFDSDFSSIEINLYHGRNESYERYFIYFYGNRRRIHCLRVGITDNLDTIIELNGNQIMYLDMFEKNIRNKTLPRSGPIYSEQMVEINLFCKDYKFTYNGKFLFSLFDELIKLK